MRKAQSEGLLLARIAEKLIDTKPVFNQEQFQMAVAKLSRSKKSVLLSTESAQATLSIKIPALLAGEIRDIRREAKLAGLQFPIDQLLAGELQKIAEKARAELNFVREQKTLELIEK